MAETTATRAELQGLKEQLKGHLDSFETMADEAIARHIAAKAEIQFLKDMVAELRQSRDDWKAQAERLAGSLREARDIDAGVPLERQTTK